MSKEHVNLRTKVQTAEDRLRHRRKKYWHVKGKRRFKTSYHAPGTKIKMETPSLAKITTVNFLQNPGGSYKLITIHGPLEKPLKLKVSAPTIVFERAHKIG